ncbi:hypothetical protein P691DRAFT_710436 [Macrolepiota fuliginosa MF-IS2]|uniref:R3H domain-containing protein n=1 Tax=Macrolepiota fuliginosa MF-IS2 TaxID=1400762 RepID=A0A9P6BYP0_9AGAR|nr:hypothetical protein P691DRAFT_710436 [Macrolepiota fuliginosa MF-IS2]
MESAPPAGSVSVVSTSTAPQTQQAQHTQNPRPNRSHGRQKPQRQRNEIDTAPDPTHSRSQQHQHPSVVQDGVDGTSAVQQQPRRRPPKPRKPASDSQTTGRPPAEGASAGPSSSSGPSHNRRRRPPKPRDAPQSENHDQTGSERPRSPTSQGRSTGGNNRRAKFQGKLTENDGSSNARSASRPSERYRTKPNTSASDDLTSRLIRELSFPPYPDCPICFSSIYREQPIWSCSPSISTILPHDAEGPPQYCWTTFHLKCIRSWASKSVKDIEDAWRARGEEGRSGDWRCPGCQAKREVVPKVYWCFCGSIPDPKPPRLSTPHSCGGPCSRTRESGCGHPCPLPCHPGPCPPCQVTTRLTCYCPRKSTIAFRCGLDQGKGKTKNLSCGNVCGRALTCGKHTCEKVCHEGDCEGCSVREMVRCWCGKTEKELGCGEGESQECFVEGGQPWVGLFSCDRVCERTFDCGVHSCEKLCHPPSHKPAPCPRSPTNITHCPCGKCTIAPSPNSDISQYTFPARTSCTSPIPTCKNLCEKPHHQCGHPCKANCHTGSCPPCSEKLTRPCRCGASIKTLYCYELYKNDSAEEVEILCDRPCMALRACGRHECRRPCCPLASLAMTSGGKKGKKRMVDEAAAGAGIGEEKGGLHECDLVCGKMLSCGNHRCEDRDHKGICPPCLRSSFEEMICFCGRTVYEPPIPCGTLMRCSYPCPRPTPPCGHSRIPHACHEDPTPCPPCVHLTTKQCGCGKKMVSNVRCSLESEKVSCGTVCGKLLSCGFHHCERSCHADECGQCTATCGKLRKLCLPDHHPCPLPCHAPSSCPEAEPCPSLVTVTCPCGRIKQAVHCGRSSSDSSTPTRPNLKCTNDCGVAKRNARLAEALGINPAKTTGTSSALSGYGGLVNTINYNDEVVGFARINPKFLLVVEKAFADFVTSQKRTQVLPHTPADRRKFVHDLATYYRIDTQLVDQEPHRSVQLVRRLDTRIPNPLLSTIIQPPTSSAPNLGKLGDSRNLKSLSNSGSASSSTSHLAALTSTAPSSGPTWRPVSTPSPRPGLSGPTGNASGSSAAGTTGWSSIFAPQPQAAVAARVSGLGSTTGAGTLRPQSGGVPSRPGSTVNDLVTVTVTQAGTEEHVPDNWEDDD